MSAADAARVGTGLAFVVMPLVFVFAFATHPDLLRPRVLRPEQLIDRARGKRLLHTGHGLVTLNTGLMIVVALHLRSVVTTHPRRRTTTRGRSVPRDLRDLTTECGPIVGPWVQVELLGVPTS